MIVGDCEMLKRMETPPTEFRLLLACSRASATQEDEAAIRQMLLETIDWTLFARKAISHGLAGLAGHTLARIAPDMVPNDILDAFRANVNQTRRANDVLFDELAEAIAALAKNGVEAIPFKGPVLAIGAYGDLGLRVFRDLDFLIHDSDLSTAIATLESLGYERKGRMTAAQFDLIHRLQGQEIMLKQVVGTCIEPHTRLTPIKMALDIDYPGLWRRAQRTSLNGRTMLVLAPEDDFIALAVHGGKEIWSKIKWACDIAVFVGSHPELDWTAVVERARAQGCLRMVLLATSLARNCFNAALPEAITAAERADPIIEPMVARIMARWHAEDLSESPGYKSISLDRLQLHEGIVRRARYVARTVFLPGPHHVGWLALPRRLSFAYIPVKIAHDAVALPLLQAYRHALKRTERLKNTLARSDLALAVMPASAEARLTVQRHQTARADAKRALAADPNNMTAWCDLGDALSGLKRYQQAIACYDKALAFTLYNSSIWKKRAAAMEAIGEKAPPPDLAFDPQDANAWAMRANRFLESKNFAEAMDASDSALVLDPENITAARAGIHARLFACDWRRRNEDEQRVAQGVKAGLRIVAPVFHRSIRDSEPESLILARLWAKAFPQSTTALWRGESYRHDKIRIAYLSTDFRDHVVADAIVGCFEHHDRRRFETTAISLGPNDASEMRRRVEAAFDRFIDVQAASDSEVAAAMRALEIDIAIDLNGHSGAKRPGILVQRPAPLQVNYLGYPGTMGVPFIDYIIADRITIPEENQIHYDERVAYLPHTYMPNDRTRPITATTPSRKEAGLPERGFVFACHNAAHKISPEIFDVWMRLLQTVPGSVLWLRSMESLAMGNLWHEAKARGVAPERVVFAPRMARTEDHLARLRLADLFLDTLPYNAHATACDALWAGLPVLTCRGNSFPARVAASLLHAIGLPELVTSSPVEYEAFARALALDPARLAAMKAKLMRNRDTEPLFDTARFTRDLESAYVAMWERQRAGLPPATLAVAG